MHHGHANGKGVVEGLRILVPATTGGWVAHMPHSKVPAQPRHVVLVEDLNHQPVAFLDVELVREGGDARRILAAVLNGEQTLIYLGCDVRAVRSVNANESAHGCIAWESEASVRRWDAAGWRPYGWGPFEVACKEERRPPRAGPDA